MNPADLLPACWVTLLAWLLYRALRRWYDPVPGRCWAVWAGVIAVLFGPVLAGGKVLLPLGYLVRLPPFTRLAEGGPPPGNLLQGDLVLQIAPWLELVRAALADGRWPLWNHLAGAGEPLLGNPQAQALQPLAWLALVFPVASAVGVLAAFRVLLALVFTWLFLRRQGISALPSLGGSLVFGLGGFLLGWAGWPLAGSAAVLPLLLYALTLADERGARRDFFLLALAGALLLLVGHPETALYVVVFVAAFAGLRLLGRRAERGRRLAAWGLAGLLGAGLAAPALLPALAALPQSRRAELMEARRERVRAADRQAGWGDPEVRAGMVRRLVPLAVPNAFGSHLSGRYWGERNALNDTAGWTGTAALLAALAGLASLISFKPERGKARAGETPALPAGALSVLGAAAALLAVVVLVRPPGLVQLLDALPLLRQSASFHSRTSLLLNFGLALLAAVAWERWRRGALRRPAVLAAAAGLALLLVWGTLAHPFPANPEALARLRYGSLALHLATLAVCALLLAFVRPRLRAGAAEPRLPAWAALALLALVAAEPLALRLPANPGTPRHLYYPETAPIHFLREHLAAGERLAGLDSALRPNFATVYGLADARSSNPARPAAVVDALRRINSAGTQATDVLDNPGDPLYGLLGVRFVIAPPRRREGPPLQRVLKRGAAWVYERPGALPRLFLPAAAAGCTLPSWSGCTAGVTDFGALAMVRELPAPWATAAPAAGRLTVEAVEPALVRAAGSWPERRLLASSVYQDGGWSLLVGGRRLPTTLANGPFVAAWLPAVEKTAERVELVYRPPGFFTGLLLAALALAGGLAWWVRPPVSATTATARR
jgi:hypothetical protein